MIDAGDLPESFHWSRERGSAYVCVAHAHAGSFGALHQAQHLGHLPRQHHRQVAAIGAPEMSFLAQGAWVGAAQGQ